jgi:hypothetical protein
MKQETVPADLNMEEVHLVAAHRAKAQERFRRTSKINQLRTVLQQFVDHEIEREASGDCGSWDVEDDPIVKEARRVLALTDPKVKDEVTFGV